MVKCKGFLLNMLIFVVLSMNFNLSLGNRLIVFTNLDWSDFGDITYQFEFQSDLQRRSWMGDVDNDSDMDILIGSSQGGLLFYRNIGTGGNDFWILDLQVFLPMISQQIGRVVPAAGDLDGDNDFDLILGGDDGHLYISVNEGTCEIPIWSEFSVLHNSDGHIFNFTGQANPTLIDYDNDSENLLDLVVGSDIDANTEKYEIYTYMNTGNQTHYSFGITTYPWAGEEVPYGPKNISGALLKINPTKNMTGSMRINFALLNIDLRPDMILIFDSGVFEFFISSGISKDPIFLPLDKEEHSITFNFPLVKEEPFIDVQWYGSTDAMNITSPIPVSGGYTKSLIFRNSGEVLIFPPSTSISIEKTVSTEEPTTAISTTESSRISPGWSMLIILVTFSLLYLLRNNHKFRYF